MRIRNLKPEFWRSADVARLPRDLRLLYVGLWSYVDDNGVGIDDPLLIASDLFPREEDPVEARDWVREGLQRLSRESRCVRYTVDGKAYIYVLNWKKHQKVHNPNKPRYPLPCGCIADEEPCNVAGQGVEVESPPETLRRPSGDSTETLGTGSGGQGDRGSEGQGGSEAAAPPASRKRSARASGQGTRIPGDFVRTAITPELVQWVRTECPLIDARFHTDNFVDYWVGKTGKDATKLDWVATWRKWMRGEQEKAANRQQSRPGGVSPGRGGKAEGWLALGLATDDEPRPFGVIEGGRSA